MSPVSPEHIKPSRSMVQMRNADGVYRRHTGWHLQWLACAGLACWYSAMCGLAPCVGDRCSADEPTSAKSAELVPAQAAAAEFFEQRIRPVLVERCYECHSAAAPQLEGGLRVDTRAGLREGGDSGAAVVPGKLADSLLFSAITNTENSMPPDAPLPPDVIADFRHWILSGAFDPRAHSPAVEHREPDYGQAREFWSFQPVQPPTLPETSRNDWCRTPIDRFIAAQMDAVGLQPSPEAAPEVLLRRVSFDLTGLPPTVKQLQAFAQEPSEQHYRRLVDELLDSPHYGERQAQHWLDVVRYAETEGFEYDRLLPDMWRYRDYVISAMNADKPYDQFVMEQLAGDELGDTPELRIAAGFHRLGAVRRNAGNQAVASSRNEVLTERTDIIGTAFLGLTVGCARCHDHKFDPIPQRDYYRLQAFLAATQEENISLRSGQEREQLMSLKRQLEARIDQLKADVANLDGEAEARVKAEIKELEAQLPADGPTICSIRNDWQTSSPITILRRGDPDLPGASVGMRGLGLFSDVQQPELPFDTPQPRTLLAQQLIDPRHPLTARVIVNRLWQQHFGAGLVSTPNDFGKNGAPPSHPQLLDYLADTLVQQGWQFKAFHRELVTSSVYRQRSQPSRQALSVDPENRWLSHFSRRRLSGEEIRDAMLVAADELNRSLGGPSVVLPVDQELVDQLYKPSQWTVSADPAEHRRRSIYLLAKRNLRLPFMEVFDQPSSQTSCAVRQQSTHARQALELLNGPIANELAGGLERRLRREFTLEGSSVRPSDWSAAQMSAIVERAFWLVAGRAPLSTEQRLSQQFVHEQGLSEFCLAMFNLNAFLYVD